MYGTAKGARDTEAEFTVMKVKKEFLKEVDRAYEKNIAKRKASQDSTPQRAAQMNDKKRCVQSIFKHFVRTVGLKGHLVPGVNPAPASWIPPASYSIQPNSGTECLSPPDPPLLQTRHILLTVKYMFNRLEKVTRWKVKAASDSEQRLLCSHMWLPRKEEARRGIGVRLGAANGR
ncbi:hypothetical protein NDU88_000989 [Pleurodeles waltl]|uniref:Uncharacterized protein n=1 Tax=Pleurodeles waltl TaxID=8319 RepID=A0AAV7MJB0_PLEWA|nr:hypothetical protein NDU88_000989 [Pleurodeles waltl]